MYSFVDSSHQRVTKRCRLQYLGWPIYIAPSYKSPNAGGGKVGGLSQWVYCSCAHGAQINFGDLTPSLTFVSTLVLLTVLFMQFCFHPLWSRTQYFSVPWSFVLFTFSVVLLYSIVTFRILNYFCVHTKGSKCITYTLVWTYF